jgi:hypothetical protein
MLAALVLAALLGVLVTVAIHSHYKTQQYERALNGLRAALPKLAEQIAEAKYETFRRYERLASQTGILSTNIHREVVHIQRNGTIKITVRQHSQLLWLRWRFLEDDHEMIDFWQFGTEAALVMTTSKAEVPAWTSRVAPCTRTPSPIWRLCAGDRLVYIYSCKLEGDIGEVVNVFEADENAQVSFVQETTEPQLAHIDDRPERIREASIAFKAAKAQGPPRNLAIDIGSWHLA